MSSNSESAFYSFLGGLPIKYVTFYMLMDSYKLHLSLEHPVDSPVKSIVSNILKDEIMKTISEDTSTHKIVEKKKVGSIDEVDKKFDEELGEWASSFSSSEEEESQNTEKPVSHVEKESDAPMKQLGVIKDIDDRFDEEFDRWVSSNGEKAEQNIKKTSSLDNTPKKTILDEMVEGNIASGC